MNERHFLNRLYIELETKSQLVIQILACVLITVISGAAICARAQSITELNPLRLNERAEHQLEKDDVHKYTVTLRTGEFVHVLIEQKGIDVEVRIQGKGKQFAEMDSPNDRNGFEELSFIAPGNGIYYISVERHRSRPSIPGLVFADEPIRKELESATGTYEITLTEKRVSNAIDRKRVQAEKDLLTLFRSRGVDTFHSNDEIQAEIAKYQRMLTVWQALKNSYIVGLLEESLNRLKELIPIKEIEAKVDKEEEDLQAEKIKKRKASRERVRKINKATAVRLSVPTGAPAMINSIAFSSDGQMLATATGFVEEGESLNIVKLWDVKTGREVQTLIGHEHVVTSVAFVPGEKIVASGSEDKTIRLWDIASGADVKVFLAGSPVRAVAISPDGRVLAAGVDDGTVRLWNTATDAQLGILLANPSHRVYGLSFSRDGKYLAAGSQDTIKIWDTSTWRFRSFKAKNDLIASVAFAPDGKVIASGGGAFSGANNVVRLWSLATGRNYKTLEGFSHDVESITFSPNGDMLASLDSDNVIFWKVSTGQKVGTIQGGSRFFNSIAYSPDGQMLAFVQGTESIQLWDVATQSATRLLTGRASRVRAFAFSSDQKTLATSTGETAKLWSLTTGRGLTNISKTVSREFGAVAFSPDRKCLALGAWKDISVWDLTAMEEIAKLKSYDWEVSELAISSDCGTLASVSGAGDPTITLWDLATGKKKKTLIGHRDSVMAVAFSADGTLLASGSFDGTIRVWNVASGTEINHILFRSAHSMVFSPDAKTLAVRTYRGIVKMFDVSSGQELGGKQLPQWAEKVFDNIMTTPNGKRIRAEQEDNRLVFRDVTTEEELASLIALDDREWAVVDPSGRWDASSGAQDLMYYVISTETGYEFVALSQLKARYYEPSLLPKILGYNNETIRDVTKFENPKLYPNVMYSAPEKGSSNLRLDLYNRGGGLGRVEVFVNGVEFLVDARTAEIENQPDQLRASLTVDLSRAPSVISGSDNDVRVVVWNLEDYMSSQGVDFVWKAPGPVDQSPPAVYAIVGGISKYSSPQLDLNFAAKDAIQIANAIDLGARRLFGSGSVHLSLLTTADDPRAVSPTKENFARAFEVARKAKPTDILFVYLAGHGVSLRVGAGSYGFLTKEARTTNLEALLDPLVLRETTVTSDELIEWIKQIPANKRVIVLDTCAAGAAESQFRTMDPREPSGDTIRAIERARQRTGSFMLMGAAADARAYETSQFGQGNLTHALLKGMKGPALRDDEFINVDKLFQYARDEVEELAKTTGRNQRPAIFARKDNFEIGQLKTEDKEKIFLATPKPIVLRPFFYEVTAGVDSLGLMKAMRAQLRDETYGPLKGEAAFVFFDDEEFKGGFVPAGNYSVDGNDVTVTLRMRRDGQEMPNVQITGSINDVAGLAAQIVSEIKLLVSGRKARLSGPGSLTIDERNDEFFSLVVQKKLGLLLWRKGVDFPATTGLDSARSHSNG